MTRRRPAAAPRCSKVPSQASSLGPALSAAAALVRTAEEEAKAVTEELDEPEREALRRAFGEGSTGKGVAKAMRGMAGAMKDLEDRQKSRATRVKRDTLDQALLELALFYRDVLMVQVGADVELASPEPDLRQIAASSTPEATLRRIQAIMHCRDLLPLNVAPLLAVEEMTLSLAEGNPPQHPPQHPPRPSAPGPSMPAPAPPQRPRQFKECAILQNLLLRKAHSLNRTGGRDGADGERGRARPLLRASRMRCTTRPGSRRSSRGGEMHHDDAGPPP